MRIEMQWQSINHQFLLANFQFLILCFVSHCTLLHDFTFVHDMDMVSA